MDPIDIEYVKKCRFVVASAIFDGYDLPHQPSNLSPQSYKHFFFLMVVDEESPSFIKSKGNSPYDEPRRNGEVPKILTHGLFHQTQYKYGLMGEMLFLLAYSSIFGKNTFAIGQHKHHCSTYENTDENKPRKPYARPLIDLQMKIYKGMEPWNPMKGPRGCTWKKSPMPRDYLTISHFQAMNR
ncbi:hypothetical protein SAY86_004085 [Trapa natans]|uniref:TOD1/MUCI70 glycosyltransferase-like domain-containing protein n=1 Tax=Trapa natans TaxID=22666 RepID=A0AAN7M773_TRANT|nr:hypothetical protein SAY86_004085 [Trapa natans]